MGARQQQGQQAAVFELRAWSGLSILDPTTMARPGQLERAENVIVTKLGGLKTVEGHRRENSGFGEILGYYRFHKNDQVQTLVFDDNGKFYVNGSEVQSGLDTSAEWSFAAHERQVIMTNGVDPPLKWDGTVLGELGLASANTGTASLSAAVGTQESKTVHNMEGWTEVKQNRSGSARTSYIVFGDTSIAVELRPGQDAEAKITGLNLDLSTFDGGASVADQDYMKLKVSAATGSKKRKDIGRIRLQVDVNLGDFATDYYEAEIDESDFPAGERYDSVFSEPGFITLHIKRERFVRVGGTGGQDWSTTVGLRIIGESKGSQGISQLTQAERDRIDEIRNWKIPFWEDKLARGEDVAKANAKLAFWRAELNSLLPPPASGARFSFWLFNWDLVGGYDPDGQPLAYTVTVGDGSTESAGAQVVELDVYRSKVDLTNIITGGSSITQRTIYRKDPLFGSFKKLDDILDNTTTTYTDDTDTLDLGSEIRSQATKPAPISKYVIAHFSRLIWANIDTGSHEYNWSGLGVNFETTDQGPEPLSDPDDDIQGLVSDGQVATLFTKSSIWTVQGDASSSFFELKHRVSRGAAAPRSIAPAESVTFFLARDSIYAWNGQTAQKVGAGKIDEIVQTRLDPANISEAAGVYWPDKARYMLAYTFLSGSENNRVLMYDLETGAATEAEVDVKGWHYDKIDRRLFFWDYDGNVFEWGVSDQFDADDDPTIPWDVWTTGIAVGSVHRRKRWSKLSMDIGGEGTAIFELWVDGDSTPAWASNEKQVSGREHAVYQLRNQVVGRWVRLRARGQGRLDHLGAAFEVYATGEEVF